MAFPVSRSIRRFYNKGNIVVQEMLPVFSQTCSTSTLVEFCTCMQDRTEKMRCQVTDVSLTQRNLTTVCRCAPTPFAPLPYTSDVVKWVPFNTDSKIRPISKLAKFGCLSKSAREVGRHSFVSEVHMWHVERSILCLLGRLEIDLVLIHAASFITYPLSALSGGRHLNCSHNRLSNLLCLSELKLLETLDAADNNISNLSDIVVSLQALM